MNRRHLLLLAWILAASCGSDPGAPSDTHGLDQQAQDLEQDDSSDQTGDLPDALTDMLDTRSDSSADLVTPDTHDVSDQPVPLKIMSFNLRNALAMDGEDAWKYRESIVMDFLEAEKPDIVGTQEAMLIQLDAITAAFPHYKWVGVGRNHSALVDIEEFCAVVYDTNRFTLEDNGTFWLSDTPDEPATKFSDNQEYPRIVTWARLLDKTSGTSLYHFNTHYDLSEEDSIPQRSSALIVQRIQAIAGDLPTTLSGDFNESLGAPAYQILVGDLAWEGTVGTLLDPWTELGLPDTEGSFHSFTGIPTSDLRIDWLLHTNHYTPLEAVISHYNQDGSYPSDHFPVWMRVVRKAAVPPPR